MFILALTDHGNMYGAIEFYKKCKKAGIKPLIGLEAYLAPESRFNKSKGYGRSYHLTLLAENYQGYQNLIKLSTKSWLEGFYYKPRIDKELLKEYHKGIICLSGCPSSEISRYLLENNFSQAERKVFEYIDIFGKENFYLELNYHPKIEDSQKLKSAMIKLAEKTKIPLVATYDVHYCYPEDSKTHDIFLAIQTGKDIDEKERLTMREDDFSLASLERIKEIYADVPEAIDRTQEIKERINVEIELGKPKLPVYPLPSSESSISYLRKICQTKMNSKKNLDLEKAEARLEYELRVIEKTGFADYFLIVADIVNWAKSQNIMVGPGRGSAGGSFVSYLLGITEIDPLKYNLLFERFLNPERLEFPDIDIDFSDTKRDKVFSYVEKKFGENKVAQIITFGKMASRAAIRDAGRALGYSFSFVDKLARLIPANMPLKEAENLLDVKKIIKDNSTYQKILYFAKGLEGIVRQVSVHACGVVIAPQDITNFTPLQFAPKGEKIIITQYDMHSVNELGLLKIDFLGLRNLSIIESAKNLIKERRNIDVQFTNFDDQDTYELLSQGNTVGIFQLESKGMTDYLKKLKPEKLEDIAVLLAMYRPGPLNLIPSYLKRRFGKEAINYLHPKLESILQETYGIMIYQEQLMKIAQELGGYTPFEADFLRKAVGKKIKSLLDEQIKILTERMIARNIDKEVAYKIGELIEPFARYGFNKSHAVAYAIISYYTAYLKAHFPIEFLTSCLIHENKDIERVKIYLKNAKEYGFKVLPPDINESGFYFTIIDDRTLRFGLSSIKNVGKPLIEFILSERKKGPFKNIVDFFLRVKHKDMDKKSLESLIKAGAFDCFHKRELLLGNLDYLIEYHQRIKNIKIEKSLFGTQTNDDLQLKPVKTIRFLDILKWEKELLGLYLSGHPCEILNDKLHNHFKINNKIKNIRDILKILNEEKVSFLGVINEIERKISKNKQPYAYMEVEDLTDKIEVVLFSDVYEKYFEILIKGNIYYFIGNVQRREKNNIVVLDNLVDITDKVR